MKKLKAQFCVQALITFFTHIATALLVQDTFSHWPWCWVLSFAVKCTSYGMAKLGPGLATLLWGIYQGTFINTTWTTARQKDFWSPLVFVHNWCNHQQYANPRMSAFIIKLQYHFLPLKMGLRSGKVQFTKSRPPIHFLYALMARGCDTFTLPLPHFHRFMFSTDSTLTALLPIVTTLMSFHRISSIRIPDVK